MTTTLMISASSTEYVRVRVSAKNNGVVVNPTGDTVQMAFISGTAEPVGLDWKTAAWETDAATDPDTYYARCLVGPFGTVALLGGTYRVWVKITDSPEVPVKRVGSLVVTGSFTFDPSIIPGLLYWYKADVLTLSDGDPVATWVDSSGNGRNLTQSTTSLRPTYRTNVVNGKPVVRFDGIDDYLRSGTFASEPQPNTLALVFKRVAFASAATVATGLDANNHNSIQVAGSGSNKLTYAAPDAKNDGGLTAGQFYIVTAVFDGGASQLFLNGADVTPAGVGPGTQPLIGVHLGSAFSGVANFFDGDIAEYLWWNTGVLTNDRRNVEAYLGTKYGITVV